MAIVKFISDQDCHIFIDKENVGKVTVDSLLKVALEIGGYLIEVKDEEGKILKKYNLEIKTTDNQILQDVSGASASTDEVLNLLKNDPTLVFHCGRAKFCLEGKYGYVNKKFEVVIPAIYSIANDFVNNKAFVVRDFPEGRKTTMIDEDGNMFFNQWYDYIGESETMILFGLNDRIIVYSKLIFKKEKEYINMGYNYKSHLIPARKDDTYGLCGYIDFNGDEIIPFVFNQVGNFNEEGNAEINIFGNDLVININGFLIWDENLNTECYSGWNYSPEQIIDFFDEQERGSLSWYGGDYCYGYDFSWEFLPIWKDNHWCLMANIGNNSLKSIVECDLILGFGYGYCIIKLNRIIKVMIVDMKKNGFHEVHFDSDNVQLIMSDNLQPILFLTQREREGRTTYSCYIYDPIKRDISPILCDYVDSIILPGNRECKLTVNSIIDDFPTFDNRKDVCLKVSYRGMYGLIDIDGNEIIPAIYADIIFIGEEFFKVKTDQGWKLGRSYFEQRVDFAPDMPFYEPVFRFYEGYYDDILLCPKNNEECVSAIAVKSGNKVGYIRTYRDGITECSSMEELGDKDETKYSWQPIWLCE